MTDPAATGPDAPRRPPRKRVEVPRRVYVVIAVASLVLGLVLGPLVRGWLVDDDDPCDVYDRSVTFEARRLAAQGAATAAEWERRLRARPSFTDVDGDRVTRPAHC